MSTFKPIAADFQTMGPYITSTLNSVTALEEFTDESERGDYPTSARLSRTFQEPAVTLSTVPQGESPLRTFPVSNSPAEPGPDVRRKRRRLHRFHLYHDSVRRPSVGGKLYAVDEHLSLNSCYSPRSTRSVKESSEVAVSSTQSKAF